MSDGRGEGDTATPRAARRRLLRALAAGSACSAGNALPAAWKRPLVDAVVVPAHAQATGVVVAGGPACGPAQLADRIPDVFRGADFTRACLEHDRCYGPAGDVSRIECDLRFLRDLLAACRRENVPDGSCYRVALVYFRSVRKLGGPFFRAGRAGRR